MFWVLTHSLVDFIFESPYLGDQTRENINNRIKNTTKSQDLQGMKNTFYNVA